MRQKKATKIACPQHTPNAYFGVGFDLFHHIRVRPVLFYIKTRLAGHRLKVAGELGADIKVDWSQIRHHRATY